jgi:hypothetical protein
MMNRRNVKLARLTGEKEQIDWDRRAKSGCRTEHGPMDPARQRLVEAGNQRPHDEPLLGVRVTLRVWKYELQPNRAKLCTRECYSAFRRFFSKALVDGRLELILANGLAIAKAENKRWPGRL